LELFAFTREYVERLRGGDPSTELHFVAYFGQLLNIKLRAKMLPTETIEEVRQDTFIRVLTIVRKDGVREPERFGAMVNSVCNRVLMESYRSSKRTTPLEDDFERADDALDQESMLVTAQAQMRVRQVLETMPERDRALLRAFYLEEKEKDEVCQEFGVDRDYFRVLLHRAKDKFKVLYEKDLEALSIKKTKGVGSETK
jgi:RNA polymerase sigma-70 factor, ECF subfamily